jgi:predicted O-methyltransferase YrrM
VTGSVNLFGRLQGVEGWLTDEQALRLADRARTLHPPARIVEIGSYRGRSTITLASSAPEGVTVVAVDPHAGDDRGPRQVHGTDASGEADHRAFVENLTRAGVVERVEHVRLPSQEALATLPARADLVYVDGAHRYRAAREDLTGWGGRLRPRGTLLVHDAWSSVGVTPHWIAGGVRARRSARLGTSRQRAAPARGDSLVRAQPAGQGGHNCASPCGGAAPRPPHGALAVLRL